MLLGTEKKRFAKSLMHFQPFKGPKFQNFPGGHAPGTPYLLDKNTNVIFAQRIAGTTFEDSFMT